MSMRWMAGLLTAGALLSAGSRTAPAQTPPGKKRALLVAVGKYPRNNPDPRLNWATLHSELDARNMQEALTGKWTFPGKDVVVLENEQATREAILKAFDDHLIAPAKAGDVLVFMFSGHGQQVLDQPEGEPGHDERDGMDETLVPYDYRTQKAADGAKTNIRDDDLQERLKKLSQRMRGADGKVDGNVTMIVDSCHSGTVVRGNVIAKGRGWDEALDGARPHEKRACAGDEPRLPEGRLHPEGSGFFSQGEAEAQGYVLLNACQSHESAYEVTEDEHPFRTLGGNLVYAVCQALRTATPETTYRDLFEAVKARVRGSKLNQTPDIEGEIHQKLFSGLARPEPAYPRVLEIRDGAVVLSAGRIHGVTKGSRYWLTRRDGDAKAPANRLVEVTVSGVELYRSQALLPKGVVLPPKAELEGAKAVLSAYHYGENRLQVLLEGTQALTPTLRDPDVPADQDALQLLSADPPAARGERPERPKHDFRITLEVPPGAGEGAPPHYVVRRETDTETMFLATAPNDGDAGPKIRRMLLGRWRWRFLSDLSPADSSSPVEVKLRVVPVTYEKVGERIRVTGEKPPRMEGGTMLLGEEDCFGLAVQNTGPVRAWVHIFHLKEDGGIEQVFPDPLRRGLDNEFAPGTKPVRVALRVPRKPYGTEVFKLIATAEKLDLSPLIYQAEALTGEARGEAIRRGAAAARGGRGSGGALQWLLQTAATGRRDVGEVLEVEPEFWAVDTVTLETR